MADELQVCGHPVRWIYSGDEGTSHCKACFYELAIETAKGRCTICIRKSDDKTQWVVCEGCQVEHGYNGPETIGTLIECHACSVATLVRTVKTRAQRVGTFVYPSGSGPKAMQSLLSAVAFLEKKVKGD